MSADRPAPLKQRVKAALGALRAPAAPAPAEAFPSVDCYSWRPKDGRVNFGDHLAEIVVDAMLGTRGLMRHEETARQARLFSIGSVLHFARDGDTVWGSGINGKIADELNRFATLDVRAVRGPRTAEYLRQRGIAVPDIFGDPALLIPRLFPQRFVATREGEPIFIPNLNDLGQFDSPIPTVSPLRGWNHVIARIVASRLVLASSLHGLILAEAYGVPARYVRLSERESLFKYHDYYEGTGRFGVTHATSIEEGLEQGGAPALDMNFDALQDAFPFDLWTQPGQARA